MQLRRNAIELAVCALGLVLVLGFGLTQIASTATDSDFSTFRAGAALAGRSEIYRPDDIRREIRQVGGDVSKARCFYLRWPWYSFVTYPISRVPYAGGFLIWKAISLLALIGALLAWRGDRLQLTIAACWSVPAAWSIAVGQDATAVLAAISLSVLAFERDLSWTSGALLAVASSIKPNLTVPVIAVFAIQRHWRVLGSWLLASGLLTGISFVLAGSRWPILYFRAASDRAISPMMNLMPGFGSLWIEHKAIAFVFALIIAVICAYAATRNNLRTSIEIAVVAALLISPHSYAYDCVLLLPLAGERFTSRMLRVLVITVLSPAPYLLLLLGVHAPMPILLAAVLVAQSTQHLHGNSVPLISRGEPQVQG